ncbi:MAG: sigma-70 family RNA polymerase sigma factor [Phycisphaerales bacterium]|nr:sigma-70 family RNA polymerase sigma factor [Phycisphaerales bacterium]
METNTDISPEIAGTRDGSNETLRHLLPLIYRELHGLAASALRRERGDHTLQPTALVHEAYMRLLRQSRIRWDDRAQVLSAAAQIIRHVLVDHARTRRRKKRQGDQIRVPLSDSIAVCGARDVDVLALDEAIAGLAAQSPRCARVVEMRFFGGATAAEIAVICGVNPRTVERDWQFARAWLYRALSSNEPRSVTVEANPHAA